MSEYTQQYRQENFKVGFCEDRGPSWWGDVDNISHFAKAIPLDVVTAELGWDPIQVPMSFQHPLTGTAERYALEGGPQVVLRSDTMEPIGFNAGGTKLFGLRDWFLKGPAEILDQSQNELGIGFIGLFKNGAQAAMQLELSETMTDAKSGVEYRPFLYAATSLDGSMLSQYGKGVTRMVCDNTFRAGVREAQNSGLWYGVRQTKNAQRNTLDARNALGIVAGMEDEVNAELHKMIETTVSPKQWDQFLTAYVPIPEADANTKSGGRGFTTATKKRDEIEHLWQFDNRVSPWAGTAFGVSQAVTTWAQHYGVVRNAGRIERNKINMITGKADNVETEALNLLDKVLANA